MKAEKQDQTRSSHLIQKKDKNDTIEFLDNRHSASVAKNSTKQLRHAPNSCFQLRVIDPGNDNKNFKDFQDQTFEKEYTDHGHFTANYIPKDKTLAITLKVSFPDTGSWNCPEIDSEINGATKKKMTQEEQDLFKETVVNTWSNKWNIETDAATPHKPNVWRKLNPTKVKVSVTEDASAPSYKIIANDSAQTNHSMVSNRGYATLSKAAFARTMYAEHPVKYWLSSYYGINIKKPDGKFCAADEINKYNVYAHEAGHMFGFGDEYITDGHVKGDETSHYQLTREVLGKKYANANAKMNDDHMTETLMGAGTTVQPHHYVTFWDAMCKALSDKGIDENKAPVKRKDWKIKQ